MFARKIPLFLFGAILMTLLSCQTSGNGDSGKFQTYPIPSTEATWILEGNPIEFENERWYPQDGIESLLDSEVLYKGTYKDVQFFVDRLDVRPYKRLYTKFDKNKFRYYRR